MTLLVGLLASIAYLAAAYWQFASVRSWLNPNRTAVIGIGLLAAVLHAVTAFNEILPEAGIAFGLFDMASLIILVVVAIILLSSLRRPLENLFVFVLPLAAASVVLSVVTGNSYTPRSELESGVVAHVLLSVTAYGVLTIAALEAVLVTVLDRSLRNHSVTALRSLPPLQTMDALLFELLAFGCTFLSLAIGSGFLFIDDIFARKGMVHHTTITLCAWVVFMLLMWGRYRLGWRGATAARWALAGFGLLVLGYFGSKAVLELVLTRV